MNFQQVDTRDQLFPMFVMQIFGDVPCVPGLFIAGIFSGTLSTVSGGLNSLATVTLLDFVEAGAGWELSKKTSLFITKSLALAYGLICFGFVYVAKYLPGVLEVQPGVLVYMASDGERRMNLGCSWTCRNDWRTSPGHIHSRDVLSVGKFTGIEVLMTMNTTTVLYCITTWGGPHQVVHRRRYFRYTLHSCERDFEYFKCCHCRLKL